MTSKKPPSLTALLGGQNPHLAGLAAEARRLEALRLCVAAHLAPETGIHCLGADLKDGILTLFLDSAVWTTALRYQHQTLLAAVQRDLGQACHSLKLRVLPEPIPGVPPKRPPGTLSAGTRQLLDSTAAGLEDQALAAALRRLARTKPPRP
jgi:hypothetical protein